MNIRNLSPKKLLWVVAVSTLITGCSFTKSEVDFQEFVTSFEHIKLGHPINRIKEELIWVNANQLLTFAVVSDEKKSRTLGLYLVSSSGKAELLIEGLISRYCIRDQKLLIQGHKGRPDIVGDLPAYEIEVISEERIPKSDERIYSDLRCGFVALPDNAPFIYRALKEEDGFVEVTIDDDAYNNQSMVIKTGRTAQSNEDGKNNNRPLYVRTYTDAFFRNNKLKSLWDIRVYDPNKNERIEIDGKWPVPPALRYSRFLDSYTGFWDFGTGQLFWSLNLEKSTVEFDKFLYPREFVNRGGIVPVVTRAGYMLNHVGKALYVRLKGEMILLEKGWHGSLSVSPDGCHVAYAEGNILRPKKDMLDYKQTLKIANICKYVSAREIANDGH